MVADANAPPAKVKPCQGWLLSSAAMAATDLQDYDAAQFISVLRQFCQTAPARIPECRFLAKDH
jgi:hypothetical protein